MSPEERRLRRQHNVLLRLLTEAKHALEDEMMACTEQEIREHPTLRKHQRVLRKITRKLIELRNQRS